MTGRHVGEARGSDKSVRHFSTNKIQAALTQPEPRSTLPLPAGPLGPLRNPVKPGASPNAEPVSPPSAKWSSLRIELHPNGQTVRRGHTDRIVVESHLLVESAHRRGLIALLEEPSEQVGVVAD